MDVINAALGVSEDFGPGTPVNCRAIEVGASVVDKPDLKHAFTVFNRPQRLRPCDERDFEPNVPQTMFLMTDPEMLYKLKYGTRVKALLTSDKTDEQVLEELFLATLSRFSTEEDRRSFAEFRKTKPNREDAFMGIMWALINTREFILNH